jgi:virginiamycin B lyase
MTTSGAVTEFSAGMTSGANPHSIAAGSDGNLWFTQKTGSSVIGKITPQGSISNIPVSGTGPTGIGVGPDGNIWVTYSGSNLLSKIGPGNRETDYSFTDPQSGQIMTA